MPSPVSQAQFYNNVSLNTPIMSAMAHASPAAVPSPQSEEQRRYAEKLQQLSCYIDPLRKMIEQIERDEKATQNKNEVAKIKRLLDIISDPHSFGRGVTLETLLKCEQVLERMDFKPKSVPPELQQQPAMHAHTAAQPSANVCQPLVDAIQANIKKPHLQSTLARTFSPAAAALGIVRSNACISSFRSDIVSEAQETRVSREQEEAESQEWKDDSRRVLEGEIARLDPKFKVEEDVLSHPSSRSTQLLVSLDSLDLPYVPPLVVRIPSDYPSRSPTHVVDGSLTRERQDNLFTRIESLFQRNSQKLAPSHSLTCLLQTWEQSVRQACFL